MFVAPVRSRVADVTGGRRPPQSPAGVRLHRRGGGPYDRGADPPGIWRNPARKTARRRALVTPPRACIHCCTPVPPGKRCPNPTCPRHRRAAASRGPDRSSAERLRRAKAVEAWRRNHGDVCPGFGVDAHVLRPGEYLTADHITPTSLGGDPAGSLGVLCNRCNVRKGGRNRARGEANASG